MPTAPTSCVLFLVGMPAAGKTYWAQRVAEAFGMQFVDLDGRVVEQEKISIPEIFARYEEAGFREREAHALRQLTNNGSGSMVIACGGGTPCYKDNLAHMKATGIVIYLRAGIPLLLAHLRQSVDVRPLLKHGDTETYLAELLSQRKNIYERADYIVDAETLSLTTFDKIIASCTNRH